MLEACLNEIDQSRSILSADNTFVKKNSYEDNLQQNNSVFSLKCSKFATLNFLLS